MANSLVNIVKQLSFVSGKKPQRGKGQTGRIFYKSVGEKWTSQLTKGLGKYEAEQLRTGVPMVKAATSEGIKIFIQPKAVEKADHYGFFAPTPYSMARDLAAGALRALLAENIKAVEVHYVGDIDEECLGIHVGCEMILYDFTHLWPITKITVPEIIIDTKLKSKSLLGKQGKALGSSVNLARFLVDLPANALNPKTYAELAKGLFPSKGKIKTVVWDEKRLQKEKMGLHLAVGQGAVHGPCMIHIQYRHPRSKDKPIAFVGKGITFDSGGLDIKPSSGMRLMKKDMGGSASVMGLAYWVQQTEPEINCDFYLAVAENAVSDRSFRPGDILTAKNGLTVEIHNTDAEGRLVLADVLTVASTAKPKMIIDVATLTGAIKVGLSSSVPGLFANDDNLAENLLRSAQQTGESAWRMPLVPEERGRLKSDVADLINATDGFGGAVTAALFLEKFIGNTPWAHLDIYSWVDRAKGAYGKSGGNGQLVRALAEFLNKQQTS